MEKLPFQSVKYSVERNQQFLFWNSQNQDMLLCETAGMINPVDKFWGVVAV